jgi:predicted CoA-binding protein
VDVFRPSEDLPAVVDDALASLPNLKAIWAQLGIADRGASEAARLAGVPMVQNRCIRVEHARLLGRWAA